MECPCGRQEGEGANSEALTVVVEQSSQRLVIFFLAAKKAWYPTRRLLPYPSWLESIRRMKPQ